MAQNKRKLSEIAQEVKQDYKSQGKFPNSGMIPYLNAMLAIHSSDPDARYLYEDASTIVAYFLANATTWKGETARRIKQELKTNYNL